ncbi:MAG: trypsin-like peptidase domain-containing protein [Neomegalonema sp.]|nr:trypsin-like peptidase domain-containing protein [Neomegalonema sp.]
MKLSQKLKMFALATVAGATLAGVFAGTALHAQNSDEKSRPTEETKSSDKKPAKKSSKPIERAKPREIAPRGPLTPREAAVVKLFETARESVVFITTSDISSDSWGDPRLGARRRTRGSGSGFVWDDKGHIITNHHVVASAPVASVRLSDGRVYKAELVGSDPTHDIAVLRIKVEGKVPPALPIGRSGDLRVGQTAFAIGNPFSLDWTLTRGVVSALDRDFRTRTGRVMRGLIQTDAAVNPGNSGGPLLDSAGRLIGINTAIYSPSGASAGIGFAVPVDVVNRVVPQLINTGRYAPPIIGVSIDPRVDAFVARRHKIKGVVVLGLSPGLPAEKVGLKPARTGSNGDLELGDVIVGLDDKKITKASELFAALDFKSPGQEVILKILRDGKVIDVKLTLAERRVDATYRPTRTRPAPRTDRYTRPDRRTPSRPRRTPPRSYDSQPERYDDREYDDYREDFRE